jgi:RimJ/RimL family protein N-acetyltransferase
MAGIEHLTLGAGPYALRPATAADAEAALAMSLDPAVMQWNSTGVRDLESAGSWCVRGSDWSDGSHATFAIVDGDDRYVGNISLAGIDLEYQRSASVGYRVAPWRRNRGAAGHALAAITRWGFQGLGLERIELPHSVANPASCRVAGKCGYLLEGVQRLGFRDDFGKRWDSHLHARLAGDPGPFLVVS